MSNNRTSKQIVTFSADYWTFPYPCWGDFFSPNIPSHLIFIKHGQTSTEDQRLLHHFLEDKYIYTHFCWQHWDKSPCLIPSYFLNSHPFKSGAGQEWAWVYSPHYLHRIYILFTHKGFSPAWSQFFCEYNFSTSTASALAGPFLQSLNSSCEFSAYFPAYVLFQLQIHTVVSCGNMCSQNSNPERYKDRIH